MKNLEGIEIGDRVWGVLYGYGTVIGIDNSEFPISVDFDDEYNNEFTLEGKEYSEDKEPSLFFEMPEFYKSKQYPKKPRWRASEGEKFYYILANGRITSVRDSMDIYDNKMFLVGNYFKSEEKAKKSEIYKAFHHEEV